MIFDDIFLDFFLIKNIEVILVFYKKFSIKEGVLNNIDWNSILYRVLDFFLFYFWLFFVKLIIWFLLMVGLGFFNLLFWIEILNWVLEN